LTKAGQGFTCSAFYKEGVGLTVDELRQEAQLYTELEIASNLALSAVNEFLQRLGSKALITAIVDMNPTSKGFIPLPSNCIKVQWVDVKSTGESFDKYRTRQGMIAFDTPNEVYTVTYIKTPAIVTDASSVMEIHESYRGALRLYIEGWIKANDDEEENPDSIRLREQAWADAQAVYEDLSAAYRPSREAPVDYTVLCVDTLTYCQPHFSPKSCDPARLQRSYR
jgi:hypothetical protein